jgi:hypothetical protein
MQNSSFKLTNKEFELILFTEYPLLKKNAIEKIQAHLHELGEQLIKNQLITRPLPTTSYKISKGENYLNLPYLVLDLPKIDGNHFPILCRTLFWWGKYFSFNVFIRKDAYDMVSFEKKIKSQSMKGIHVLQSDKIWQQDLDTEDYNQVSKWPENIITEGPYLKLSIKHPIEEIDTLFEKATYYYGLILSCLNQE